VLARTSTISGVVSAPPRGSLRIAQVAPLYESVPPSHYGGTERVVSYLTEELVRQGHRVTLFASGDSRTTAELAPLWDRALRLDARNPDAIALHVLLMERVFSRASQFDVIHLHTDSVSLPLARRCATPCVLTLHGRLDVPGLEPLYREFSETPVVSVSDAQRAPLSSANWIATVHHGLPVDQYTFIERPQTYLAFLGRVSREKRLDKAIAIARRVGMPLRIAAKVDRGDLDYFRAEIEPMLDDPLVEFLGEVGDEAKSELLGNAATLLFPIDWPEPFGMVMIESMACGTPVVAYRRGSVPEVIDEGITGFVVDDLESAAAAVHRAVGLDRRRVRETFERRFSATRMAQDYLRVYGLVGTIPCQLTA
jgi:glycosyltransferase involved in cell wall biosynthesis